MKRVAITVSIVAAIAIGVIILLNIAVRYIPAKASAQLDKSAKAKSMSEKFSIVTTGINGQGVAVKLRNQSERKVICFHASIGKTSVFTDFSLSERSIDSGQEFTLIAPVELALGDKVTIDGVLFDDGSDEGDPVILRRIRDRIKSHHVLRSKAVSVIENALAVHESSPDIQDLVAQIESIKENLFPDMSQEEKIGLDSALQDIKRDFQLLQPREKEEPGEITFSVKDKLSALKQRYLKIVKPVNQKGSVQ
jgi:hypothetical protein